MANTNSDQPASFLYVKSEATASLLVGDHHHHEHKSQKRPRIEPASANDGNTSSSSSSSESSTPELMRCKRRINFAQIGYNLPQAPPAAVARRNERERNRVKLVNMGFATLREHVPNGVKNKKMSKVETLRSAVDYIKRLQELLDEQSSGPAAAAAAAALAGLADTFASDGSTTGDGDNGRGDGSAGNNGTTSSGNMRLPSSVSPTCSVASSPTPSYTSDCSSYEPLSPEEEDLLDFTTWFS